jgi:hypothetical protein
MSFAVYAIFSRNIGVTRREARLEWNLVAYAAFSQAETKRNTCARAEHCQKQRQQLRFVWRLKKLQGFSHLPCQQIR